MVVVFSPSEAFCLVVCEALVHGCIPICAEFLGLRSLPWFRRGSVMTFPVGDMPTAADRVESIQKDEQLFQRLSESAVDVGRQFTWERTRREWLTAMDELLDRPPVGLDGRGGFPMEQPRPAGRLERLGLSISISEALRRLCRRYPDFRDGWGEWPGTLAVLTESQYREIVAALERLDRTGDGSC
jgi:hypothetical protein